MGYKSDGLYSRMRHNGGAHLLTPQGQTPPATSARRQPVEPGIEGTGAKVTVDRAAAVRNGLKPRPRVVNV